jgi:HK97 family phage major capsid protein
VQHTDQMLAERAAEIDLRQNFIDSLVEGAQREGRDLSANEMEMVTGARDRIIASNAQMEPLIEARRLSQTSATRLAEIAQYMRDQGGKKPQQVEYRSAGEYLVDQWRSMLGERESAERIELYHRAASHQTTADNPGLIPTPILGPVISFIDQNRALVTQLGPKNMPSQNWVRPKVTQHTTVAVQPTGEKNELVSQKMTITKLTATAGTYGGYVNVSRQDIDFSQPQIMDLVINDLAGQYAIATEAASATVFDTAATAGVAIPTGAATAAAVQTSLWDAAAKIYADSKGVGRIFAVTGPDMLPILGPVFPPVNPMNAFSTGLEAGTFGTGLVGSISGIPLYVSSGVGTLRILVFSTAGAEVFEQRVGALQVVEPSVLGVQVAYAGYFTPLVISAGSIVKIVKTP